MPPPTAQAHRSVGGRHSNPVERPPALENAISSAGELTVGHGLRYVGPTSGHFVACAKVFSMKPKRRAGATATFSVSIDVETKAILKARANRLHDGNMSALIAELGREAERREAFDRLREWAGGSVLTDDDRAKIDAELAEGWTLARDHARKLRKKKSAA